MTSLINGFLKFVQTALRKKVKGCYMSMINCLLNSLFEVTFIAGTYRKIHQFLHKLLIPVSHSLCTYFGIIVTDLGFFRSYFYRYKVKSYLSCSVNFFYRLFKIDISIQRFIQTCTFDHLKVLFFQEYWLYQVPGFTFRVSNTFINEAKGVV